MRETKKREDEGIMFIRVGIWLKLREEVRLDLLQMMVEVNARKFIDVGRLYGWTNQTKNN